MYSAAINEAKRTPVNNKPVKKIRIGSSEVEGKGLFASEQIQPGEQLLTITGTFTTHKYSPDFSAQGPDWIGATANKWIMPDDNNPIVYINHSCNPNCYINEEFVLVAAGPVGVNEELFIDYSTTEIDPYWELDCTCKSQGCRRKIKAFQYLPKSLQVKYLKYIPMRLFSFMPKA